jgi:hypothetical protein
MSHNCLGVQRWAPTPRICDTVSCYIPSDLRRVVLSRYRGEAMSYLLARYGDHAQPYMVYMLSGVELVENTFPMAPCGCVLCRTTCAF